VLNNFDRLTADLDPLARSQRAAHLAVLFLNNRNQLLAEQPWPMDTPADVLLGQIARRALELHATALILVWCRPDREASPTKSDVALDRGEWPVAQLPPGGAAVIWMLMAWLCSASEDAARLIL
jgi:DNA repair protein RadC